MAYAAKNLKFLRKLKTAKKLQRCCMLGECSKAEICAICECAENILRGKVPLNTRQKNRLKLHAKELEYLADPHKDWKKKQAFLKVQEGNGIGIVFKVLSAAIPALISLLSNK